jgi:hypothetical protein
MQRSEKEIGLKVGFMILFSQNNIWCMRYCVPGTLIKKLRFLVTKSFCFPAFTKKIGDCSIYH